LRAAVYVRISRDDGTALGVARQEADCRALVEARGWTVADVYADNDVSAYSGRVRPRYRAMLDAVKAGGVDAIVAWHPDRLHRRPVELEEFIDVVEASGVTVATVRAGEVDLGTASGRMVARVVGAMARHESEQKSERLRRKHEELAAGGKVSGGGSRPFGFEPDRVTVRPGEAAVIVEAAGRVAAGESLRSVARWLDGQCPPVGGGEWRTFSLRRMLLSPRVAGLRGHRGDVVADAVWPAIVDRVTWERVRRVLTDPGRSTAGPPRRYLLTGLLVCGLCGARLVARPKADGRQCVVCASGPNFDGCGRIRCLTDPLDELVTEAVLRHLETGGVADVASDAAPVVGDELATLEARLVELAEAWADGDLDRRSWVAARRRIEARVDELRRSLGVGPLPVGDVREAWAAADIDRRRALVALVVDRVVVGPAVRGRNVFDPGRVVIDWR